MENLLISFNVISPIFIMLVIGYCLRYFKMCDEKTINSMNDISFKVFLPLLMFYNIYITDIKGAFDLKLIIYAVLIVLIIFVLLLLIIPLVEKDNKKRGVLIQGIFRSNFVIFGLPISIALCGQENVGPTSILIAIIVPIYNAFSIVALEIFRGKGINIKRIIKGVITNPLIISALLGILSILLKIKLPTPIENSIYDISKIATPLALILLGASFNFKEIHGYKKQILIGVIGKLIVVPLIFIPISVLVGFGDVRLVALVIMLGAPTAVSTYTVAGQMDADQTLAGQLVVFDSIGSIFTMFMFIFVLKEMMLI